MGRFVEMTVDDQRRILCNSGIYTYPESDDDQASAVGVLQDGNEVSSQGLSTVGKEKVRGI